MSNRKKTGKRTAESNKDAVIIYCTTVGQLPNLMLPRITMPTDLQAALKNNLNVTNSCSQKTKNYIEFIRNLVHIKELQEEYYLFLLKMLLYLEAFAGYADMKRHDLKKCSIQQSERKNTIFTISVPTLNIDDPFIKVEDTVVLKENTEKKHIVCEARIIQIYNKNVTVVVPQTFAKKYSVDKKFNIKFVNSDWCMKCYHYALHQIYHYDLTSLMYPKIRANRKYLTLDLKWFNTMVEQNGKQKQAVINILNMTAHPAPYILFGPPGTGKTATLVELICQIWQQGRSKNILVCASSNTAVDEITMRLLKYVPPSVIHRMYSRSKKKFDVNPAIHSCANFTEEKNVFLPKEVLLLKKIVLVTLVTCTRLLTAKLKENHFSYVIIDEASQCIEPETLIPILLACSKDAENKGLLQAQVVIAGDPCQLGPVVRSKIAEPLLGTSMLERLMNCPPYKRDEENKYNPCYVTKLVQNFRSHESILHMSNKLFYDGELIACGDVETCAAIGWSKLPNKKFPIIFHAANGTEERGENSFSVYNTTEIDIAMKYLKKLVNKKLGNVKITQEHIGIVTPFKQQQIKLEAELKTRGWDNIMVGTTEVFQGREKEVIIVTTVRSRIFVHDGIRHIGFLSNPKRFNVAITRAKCLLIVIGNPMVLNMDDCWRSFMEYCIDNNACAGNSSAINQLSVAQDIYEKLKINYVPSLHHGVSHTFSLGNEWREETNVLKQN